MLAILFESAFGYSLWEKDSVDEISQAEDEMQQSLLDFSKFSKIIRLKAFIPFSSASQALENANDISEGKVNSFLRLFLEDNIPSKKKRSNFVLGILDKALAVSVKQELDIECISNEQVSEITRSLRLFASKMLKQLKEGDLEKAQLGLGHSLSRSKVKFNVNRVDNMIIQSISLLDQIDKDINTFAMRVREWYSWHFPELSTIISDHKEYAQLAVAISDKSSLEADKMDELMKLLKENPNGQKCVEDILNASKSSMGTDINEFDLKNIKNFADKVVGLYNYRNQLHEYLKSKMNNVAPNLAALIGEIIGARLIAHAGSLSNLAKYPASTIQILGAEKALFRALKKKGKTPKYGLIYHSSFIGKAALRNKGRVSRYLANKCCIASRIDCFAEDLTNKFGEAMKGQVNQRLEFFITGASTAKNIDVMHNISSQLSKSESQNNVKEKKKEKKSKSDKKVEKEEKDKKSDLQKTKDHKIKIK